MRDLSKPSPAVQRAIEQFNQPSPAVQHALRQFAQPSPQIRRALEQMSEPSVLRAVKQFETSPAVKRAIEQLSQPSPAVQRAVEQLTAPPSWARIAAAARTIAARYDIDAEVREPFEVLEEELPEADQEGSLAAALAELSLRAQVALVTAGLLILDKAGTLLTSVTGEEVPKQLRASIDLLFAVIAFLLLWIEQQSQDSEGDGNG
jgi:hypothetical protein